MKINKEFESLIPPLNEDELKQLENNLVNEGWRSNEKIITWNGIIVDGHNRFNLCQKHNIKFQSEEKKFKDKNEVILWIINNQLGRRNISTYARGELNWKKIEILKPIATAQMKSGKTLPQNRERVHLDKEVGKVSGIGSTTAYQIKLIMNNADEETKKELRRGNKKLSIKVLLKILWGTSFHAGIDFLDL